MALVVSSDGDSGKGHDDADDPGGEQPADDAAPGGEEPEQGAAEHRDLPEVTEGEAEGDGEPAMAPMTAGPAPVRNPSTVLFARIWPKRGPPRRTKKNDGAKAISAARSPPPTPAAA